MSTTSLITADDLLKLPTGMGKRYELVAGELHVMSPAGWPHGKVVGRIHTRLGSYVERHDLGVVFGAETGFRLAVNPDTVRAPDVAFITKDRVATVDAQEGFWPGAPDLAVEVLSPGDTMRKVVEKIEEWLAAGCAAVWVVDPKLQNVTVYQSPTVVTVKTIGETLCGESVIPGFECAVGELFR